MNLKMEDVRRYKIYLIRDLKRSSQTVNQSIASIKFFFEFVLNTKWETLQGSRVKNPKKLPSVLSREEISEFFNIITNIKHKAFFMLVYSCGLRKSEAINLKTSDIDSKNMLIKVCQSKNNKDRYVILSPILLDILRQYWIEDKSNWKKC